MVEPTSPLQLLTMLTSDASSMDAFHADSAAFLADHGLAGLEAVDLADALALGWASIPRDVAVKLSPTEADAEASVTELLHRVLTVPDAGPGAEEIDNAVDSLEDFGFGTGSAPTADDDPATAADNESEEGKGNDENDDRGASETDATDPDGDPGDVHGAGPSDEAFDADSMWPELPESFDVEDDVDGISPGLDDAGTDGFQDDVL